MGTAATSDARTRRAGIALCLVAACGFGLMAIFATQAYAEGVGVTTLLAVRFALAAIVFWAIVAARTRRAGAAPAAATPRRVVLAALALGGAGYSLQSGLFFTALRHIDVSMTSLLLYTYPAMVCAGSLALRRERFSAFKATALAVASAGTALVLLGAGGGGLQATGVLLGLGAALTYSVYILVAEAIVGRLDTWLFSALVASGAAMTFVVAGTASGALALPGAGGLAWIAAIALLSTVLPVSTFLLGMERVGASTAAIVSTVEPVVTVSLAVLLLGDALGPAQLAGGLLVLGAVLALQARRAQGAPAGAASASPLAVHEAA
jgi:drug/metabolite transporter (DMT)-like permease